MNVLRRGIALRSGKIAVGVSLLGTFGVVGVTGSWLVPYDPSATSDAMLEPPSAAHWLGTTQTGQDVLSQLLAGTGPTLLNATLAACIATLLAVAAGVTAGYLGGLADEVLSALTNVFLVVPLLPLLIVLSGYLVHLGGTDSSALALVIGFTGWAWGARVLRAQTLSVSSRDHVVLAAAVGERRTRIVVAEILPNIAAIVASSFLFATLYAIVLEVALGFLGLLDVQRWSWGTMLYWAQNNEAFASGAWWWFVPPGLGIALVGAGLALASFGIDEITNPRLRTGAHRRRGPRPRPGLTPVLARVQEQADVAGPLLEVRGLCVEYDGVERRTPAVVGVDLVLRRGEVLGLVGESGSGKSTLAYALTRLLRSPGTITAGQVIYRDGVRALDLAGADARTLRVLRWREIAVVVQSAMNALNPVLTIGAQLTDVLRAHRPGMTRGDRRERAARLLGLVGLDAARLRSYPHQLSGGMRQRVMIAMALALEPRILILDEPTSSLDTVTQREILAELAELRRRLGFAVLFITHDLSLLARLADTIAVMYAGRLVEIAPAERLVAAPEHPYTAGLLASFPPARGARLPLSGIPGAPPDLAEPSPGCPFAPRCRHAVAACTREVPPLVPGADPGHLIACVRPGAGVPATVILPEHAAAAQAAEPVLSADGLSRSFGDVCAVDGVSLDVPAAGIVCLVGETGSGKSTLVRMIGGMLAPTAGRVLFEGAEIAVRGRRGRLRHARRVQPVFQDPFASLNPVHTVGYHLARPLLVHHQARRGRELDDAVGALLERVALPDDRRFRARFPHELSGGQRQRVAIARALAVAPRVLLADEPVSMLDVSVRIGVLNLLGELRASTRMAILWVTHDIASARYLSDTIAVMYAGRIVECGPTAELTARPAHPYTRILLHASPDPEVHARSEERARTAPPDGTGCPFAVRCPDAMPACGRDRPPVTEVTAGHVSACWLHQKELGPWTAGSG